MSPVGPRKGRNGLQSNGTPFKTGNGNWLSLANRLQGLVLLHLLDEFSRDVVYAHALTFGWCNSIKHHAVTDTICCDSCLGSDRQKLPSLSRLNDPPVFGILKLHRTDVGHAQVRAGKNALERHCRQRMRGARRSGRRVAVKRVCTDWAKNSTILLIDRRPF